jgi:hemin uptake protein HemP
VQTTDVGRIARVDITNDNSYHSHMATTPPKPDINEPNPSPPRVSSEALLGTARQLVIMHNGREYCLRLTQNGRLILTA